MLELLGGDLTEDEAVSLMGELKDQLHFTKDILDRITLWARMRMEGGAQLNLVHLDYVKSQAEEYAHRFAKQYEVVIKVDWQEGLTFMSDADVLIIAITNLANNAVKYSPRNGVVTLGAKREGGNVVITVSDQGRGLPTEDVEKLLNPKEKDEFAINTDSMGIGLFLAREFVELTNGKLAARNLPKKGAQFSITLGAQI